MAETGIEAGKVVSLRSGGELMTVLQIRGADDDSEALCIWQAKGAHQERWYPVKVLRLDGIDREIAL